MQIKSTYTSSDGRKIDYIYYEGIPATKDLENKKLNVVQMFCFCGDKFVLVYEKKRNRWTPPGGSIELGEKYEDAVVREIKEETNMKVLHQELIGFCDFYEPTGITRTTRSFCSVEPYGLFVSDPDGDITEIKLIDPKDYKQYFDWQSIGDRIMKKAVELNKKSKRKLC